MCRADRNAAAGRWDLAELAASPLSYRHSAEDAQHVFNKQMVLQPFQERAEVLGVLQEPLWIEYGSPRDSKLQSNDTVLAKANSNNLTAMTLLSNQVYLWQFRTVVAEHLRGLDGRRYRMRRIHQTASQRQYDLEQWR